jgi:hypothetical protein
MNAIKVRAAYQAGAEAMKQAAMAACRAHRPCAKLSRLISEETREEIRAEERGERIGAEMLERAITTLPIPEPTP